MTKDRRLGRGLAALLGTPVDENGVVEGMASDAGQSNASRADASTHKPRPTTPIIPSQGVTGAVPLGSVLAAGSSNRTEGEPAATHRSTEVIKRQTSKEPTLPVAMSTTSTTGAGSLELAVDLIDSNPYQPRREFDAAEIASLAESLKEHQQLQPILVRPMGKRYQLISGERRLRAAQYAGLRTIRAEVREADDRLVAELAIVENLQRKDLNPIEKAMSFRRYLDEHTCTQDELAKRLKIDRSTIANLMRLLELPQPILDAVQSDKISAGHARALLPLGEEAEQLQFAGLIQAEGWSVRETERRVSEALAEEDGEPSGSGPKPRGRVVTPQIASLEQELRKSLGTKIEIRQAARGRGKIVVHFANADEFDRIREMLAPSPRAVA
ncbi:MAG: ParB/RepB/Spo0J family partition protein [Pirellulales bacterium]